MAKQKILPDRPLTNNEKRKRFVATIKAMGPRYYWALRALETCQAKGYKTYFDRHELEVFARRYDYCSICEKRLNWNKTRNTDPLGPCLDRINGTNELTLQNIQIICFRCARFKGDKSMSEMVQYCKKVLANLGEQIG